MGKSKVKSIRFSPELFDLLNKLAENLGTNFSDAATLMILSGLGKNIPRLVRNEKKQRLVYVSEQQGEQIRNLLHEYVKLQEQIRNELNRIGVNYNQEVRIMNEKRRCEEGIKKAREMHSYTSEGFWQNELRRQTRIIEDESEKLNVKAIDDLITRYEEMSNKVGEAIWRSCMYQK